VPEGYSLSPGSRFGPCVTVSPLGVGGVGEVWLAKNEQEGDRLEAVKVLKNAVADERLRERFIREARAAMTLGDDEKIVRTYDAGESEGRLYIRMEYVEGASLDRVVRVPAAEAMRLFKKVTAAVAVGHARDVIHRDLKPSNFMLTPAGSVKLMDFGIARACGDSTLTRTGDALGTPAYMSPEQWESAKEVDARTDVYALGVTFYKLLCGRYPFDVPRGAPATTYYAKLLSEDPIPLPALPGVPEQLPNVIYKAMAKRAEDRFPDAIALLDALRAIERKPDVPVAVPGEGAVHRLWDTVRRAFGGDAAG
jgi:eukaryotic-like serine/threonine-protein kinase